MHLPHAFRSLQSKLFVLSFCTLVTFPVAHADQASHRAKAEEMLRLTKTEASLHDQITNLQTRVGELAKQQFGIPSPTAEQTALNTEYQAKVKEITTEEVGWEKLRPLLLAIYEESFTDAELDGIIAFYKSPAGEALVNKMPQVAGKTATTVQDRIKELQPKLATLTQSYAEKMKLSPPGGAGAAPAAPSTQAAPSARPAPKPPAKP